MAAAVCSTLLVPAAAFADDSNAGSNSTPKLEVTVYKAEVQRAVITVGTNQFLFVIPTGLRMDPSKPDKIVMVPDDYSYFLSLRIIASTTAISDASQADSYRQLLLDAYPDMNIVDEVSKNVAGQIGVQFTGRWRTAGVSDRVVRVAYIPSSVGIFEFSLVADPKKTSEAQFNFKGFLRSFRRIENGKLEIVPAPDYS